MNTGLKFHQGLLVFAAVLVSMIFIAAPVQYFFGIAGLAATELMLLLTALIAARILNADFKKVFPMQLPPVRYFFASLLLYAGVYSAVLLVLMTTGYFFPSLSDVGEAIADISRDSSPALSLLIMAVLPAICEETLHRGFILSSFKHLNHTSVIVLCSGVIFGLFHLDPYRFLSTALLGGAFAYIALKTNSMILPMLFHFITNAISVYALFSYGTDNTAAEATFSYSGIMLGGYWLVAGSFAFPVIYFSVLIFNGLKFRRTVLVIAVSFILFLTGSILLSGGFSESDYLTEINRFFQSSASDTFHAVSL